MAEENDPITTASNPRVGEDVGRGTRIPADKEHLLAVAIQNAWNGDFSLIDRLRAEIASAPSPEAGSGGDLGELDDVQAALKDCSEAVAFFDQVKRSTQAEQIAVGADHWNWLEAACRRAADVHRSGSKWAAAEAEAAHLRAENANLRDRVREAEKTASALRSLLRDLGSETP